jgi:Rieske Fe-S protein
MRDLSRRMVLAGACGTCAATLAGCATYTTGRPAPTDLAPGTEVGGLPGDAPAGGAGSGVLAQTTEIPVGGGKVFADADVVVTQPTGGRFVAFSATCTHQGCTVSTITADTVDCPCHGSKFALLDGSVVNGPAKAGLPEKKISVDAGQIRLA